MLLVPVALVQQDLGTCLDRATAPQPLGLSGPMALGHPVTIGTQDAGLIPQALLNMREMPSYCGSLVNSTILELRSGSILFGKGPTCQPSTNLSEFIAKQVLCRSGLYLKHEANVKTLLPDIQIMASL